MSAQPLPPCPSSVGNNRPCPQSWKDTSAGAIAGGGLLRLAATPGLAVEAVARYQTAAERMLGALPKGYLASSLPSPKLASILANGTVSAPRGSFGTGTSFGDYFFLDALARLP